MSEPSDISAPCCASVAVLPQLVSLADGRPYRLLPFPIFSRSCGTHAEGTRGYAATDGHKCKLTEDWGERRQGLQLKSNLASMLRQDLMFYQCWTNIVFNWCFHLPCHDKGPASAIHMRHVFTYQFICIYFSFYSLKSCPNDLVRQVVIILFWASTTIHQTPNEVPTIKCAAYWIIQITEIWLVHYLSSKANHVKLYLFHILLFCFVFLKKPAIKKTILPFSSCYKRKMSFCFQNVCFRRQQFLWVKMNQISLRHTAV